MNFESVKAQVASRIRWARIQKNLSQIDLAKAIGVESAAISKYERGLIKPSIERLNDIAKALEMPLRDLLPPESNDNGGHY